MRERIEKLAFEALRTLGLKAMENCRGSYFQNSFTGVIIFMTFQTGKS